MKKNIELELRAEIFPRALQRILKILRRRYRLTSKTNRLSVMFFGRVHETEIDIRVRVTNGNSEIVLKKGGFHAHNRIEVAQEIQRGEFLGLVRVLAQLGFTMQVAKRVTYNFTLGNNIILSVVKAGMISYAEIEKMSHPSCLKRDRQELMRIIKELNLELIDSRKAFDALCDRLSASTDWWFNGSSKHYERLEKTLRSHFDKHE